MRRARPWRVSSNVSLDELRLLDSATALDMLLAMKRFLKITAIAAILISLNSCGLPAAIGRSAGRAYQGLDQMAASVRN